MIFRSCEHAPHLPHKRALFRTVRVFGQEERFPPTRLSEAVGSEGRRSPECAATGEMRRFRIFQPRPRNGGFDNKADFHSRFPREGKPDLVQTFDTAEELRQGLSRLP
jgi:hypothetical protein